MENLDINTFDWTTINSFETFTDLVNLGKFIAKGTYGTVLYNFLIKKITISNFDLMKVY